MEEESTNSQIGGQLEKQDEKGVSKSKVFLTLSAIAVIGVGGIVVCKKYVEPWLFYRHVAKDTGRSVKEVKEYYSFMGLLDYLWGNWNKVIENIDLPQLKILFEDKEIIKKAEKRVKKGDNTGLGYEISNVIDNIVDGSFVYNRDTGIIELTNSWSNEGVQIIKDYLSLPPEQRELGFFTILAARSYGSTIGDLLNIPDKLNENYFSELETNKVPASYSIPRLQNGQKVEEVIDEYSRENCGIFADLRLKYLSIKLPNFRMLSDTEISSLAKSGMKPEYFKEIITANAKEGDLNRNRVYYLIIGGKLNGEIYVKWRQAEIGPDDILCALEWGYPLPLVKEVNSRGKRIRQVHEDLLYYKFLSDLVEQRKAPSQ